MNIEQEKKLKDTKPLDKMQNLLEKPFTSKIYSLF